MAIQRQYELSAGSCGASRGDPIRSHNDGGTGHRHGRRDLQRQVNDSFGVEITISEREAYVAGFQNCPLTTNNVHTMKQHMQKMLLYDRIRMETESPRQEDDILRLLNDLNGRMAAQDEKMAATQARIGALECETRGLKAEVRALRDENHGLKVEVRALRDENCGLQARVGALEEGNTQLHAANNSLESRVEAGERENRDIRKATLGVRTTQDTHNHIFIAETPFTHQNQDAEALNILRRRCLLDAARIQIIHKFRPNDQNARWDHFLASHQSFQSVKDFVNMANVFQRPLTDRGLKMIWDPRAHLRLDANMIAHPTDENLLRGAVATAKSSNERQILRDIWESVYDKAF
ncbi:hypothetical protein AGABI2DRAFT_123135 [Agaricus bisporus var. bisporus H97]|uniref:hypothetical protein n=1 Tax=Agaricus bisporus var. bisporus (strain H97 / ATCC MYA-4626 / FGSC 10389) TaxID=936046 RepID=UPI00029F7D50|nr:hypothetical protein AGABI2DRAFT_123135 [Agaricus bisporus var. bisporus H97]EKV42016.1 hypothetical protein AGABI2DRAFT_123135 [Agaricus bisporus var. bisporus H97]